MTGLTKRIEKNRVIVVLGGAGFLGGALTRELLRQGHTVRLVDRSSPTNLSPNCMPETIVGDIQNDAVLEQALDGAYAVVYMVGNTVPAEADLCGVAYELSTGLLPHVRLLEGMRKAKVRRLVFASSGGTVYGEVESTRITEDCPLRPQHPYALGKVLMEECIAYYARTHGLLPLVLRYANPYGRVTQRKSRQGVIEHFLDCAIEGRPVEIWGDGSAVRDYIFIDDLVAITIDLLTNDEEVSAVLNVGTGVGTSLTELLELVQGITGKKLKKLFRDSTPGSVGHSILDRRRLLDVIGPYQCVPVQEGVATLYERIVALRKA